ncbi:MAG TPA: Rieske (2Fe-2S) protein [Kofleriaceae bacterium]|jgi:nitrite reductase/ring-hydroxylating ferredoxin subunit
MKRAPGLVVTRREFCALAGAIAVASCTSSGPAAISTGGLSGGGDDTPTDADDGEPHDGSTGSGSGSGSGSAMAATCPSTGATDVGAPTTFTTTTPVYFSTGKYFVIRDSGGLYAMTAVCTHEGATCDYESAQTDIYCPRHGATFSLNGAVTQGPATKALSHYAMCTLANGHVGVITSQTVSATTRLDA